MLQQQDLVIERKLANVADARHDVIASERLDYGVDFHFTAKHRCIDVDGLSGNTRRDHRHAADDHRGCRNLVQRVDKRMKGGPEALVSGHATIACEVSPTPPASLRPLAMKRGRGV